MPPLCLHHSSQNKHRLQHLLHTVPTTPAYKPGHKFVLVLKACKTEHPVYVARTPSLSSTEMGHLVRNPIKYIPHKVGLFGYFSLSLASLKSYYLFKVPYITPSRQCQRLTTSYLIPLINYPRAQRHSVSFVVW